jgi:hypothetical protein
MRKLNIITIALIAISFSTAFSTLSTIKTAKAFDPRDCIAAGQAADTSCYHIFFEGNLAFSFIQTWDPSWDYETYAGSLLGGVLYDMPVTYTGTDSSVAGLGATSAIKSVSSNGTAYTFTINTGLQPREVNPTTGAIGNVGSQSLQVTGCTAFSDPLQAAMDRVHHQPFTSGSQARTTS